MRNYGLAPEFQFARAHWIRRNVITWPMDAIPDGMAVDQLEWRLLWGADGRIDPREPEPVPWHSESLRVLNGGLPADLARRYAYLGPVVALAVPSATQRQIRDILCGQIMLSVYQPSGRWLNASGVQTQGVLDDVYADATQGEYGVTWVDGSPCLRVWAPTARTVELVLWPPGRDLYSHPEVFGLLRAEDGSWRIAGTPAWNNARYLYRVTVFVPEREQIVTNWVTDPYSVALTVNSTHSVIVNLDDPDLAPQQWAQTPAPTLEDPVDQVIYELHVRDFSIGDPSIPKLARGGFLGFTYPSAGSSHLRRLREAGLNTVQLLPISDATSIQEDRAQQHTPSMELLRSMPPDSARQQEEIAATASQSPYNWGYDPWHFLVPEGSYATAEAADGRGRIAECRAMVGALHGMGLRVVMDVVCNHTSAAGQNSRSVLDRIVPGYYHRLDRRGRIECSTCCPNVATEQRMAGKLLVDTAVLWARHYKIDGFRFDLMGHHSRDNMEAVRAALDELTPISDGVDGRNITLHGEGWNFGEVANNARFYQAVQGQLDGTHIGTFSDRLRDAVIGGAVFDEDPRSQGLGSGLAGADNGEPINGTGPEQQSRLAYYTDLVELGLAGNLSQFVLGSNLHHEPRRGDQINYHCKPAGYASQPDEVISYVDAHDNRTLFDALTMKLHPDTTMAERVRMNTLCLALATLGQSPVLWHAGTDFLRSKSLDRNSYKSGDWFNRLDFSLTDNGFASGLPMGDDNAATWPIIRPLLANPALKPAPQDMRRAHDLACELLRLRFSSRLFRLRTAGQIIEKVSFPVSGSFMAVPGMIIMLIDDTRGEPVDTRWSAVLVAANATPGHIHQRLPALAGERFELSPIQASGTDPVVKQSTWDPAGSVLRVPGRTVAVFVRPR